jgi:hypothetical protein
MTMPVMTIRRACVGMVLALVIFFSSACTSHGPDEVSKVYAQCSLQMQSMPEARPVVLGAYEFMFYEFSSCGETRMAELYGRAMLESMEHHACFTSQERQRIHAAAKEATLKISATMQCMTRSLGKPPYTQYAPSSDNARICDNFKRDGLRQKLELFDQGKMPADDVFERQEDVCSTAPFIGP